MGSKVLIHDIRAAEILDSRGNPTVTAVLSAQSGAKTFYGKASVPSGASTGSHEAAELRDGGARYGGKGCLRAVENVNKVLNPALIGMDCSAQREIDALMCELDGTANKHLLGANAILAVSLAAARAAAASMELELWQYLSEGKAPKTMPIPMMNILNGGAHADNSLDIQEYMIIPHAAASSALAVEQCAGVYAKLKSVLKSRNLSTAVGDEGGFAPNLEHDEEGLKLLCEAIEAAGFTPGKDLSLALDAAAAEWAKSDGSYILPKAQKTMNGEALAAYWLGLAHRYPIISIEDAAGEDDFALWSSLTALMPSKVILVGDDLYVTNTKRLKKGIEQKASTAVLVKPNQIGTLTETIDFIAMAKAAGMEVVLSHRSGETCDSSISDIAVAHGADYLKAGAPCRAERTEKYNRLMEIERQILER